MPETTRILSPRVILDKDLAIKKHTSRASSTSLRWLERIQKLPSAHPARLLSISGSHERILRAAGLHESLAGRVEWLAGPGCPVSICPEEDILEAMRIGHEERAIIVSSEEVLRIQVSAARTESRSLAQARQAGTDVRPVANPSTAVSIAECNPRRPVVFLVVGFEPTLALIAAMVAEGVPDNLLFLLAGRRTWPIVAHMLSCGEPYFDALIVPANVATVMGPEEWQFVPEQHGLPAAIAGFTPEQLLAATHDVLSQKLENRAAVTNCYPQAVQPGGNRTAQRAIAEVLEIVDAPWRGLGNVPCSGYRLRGKYARHDARRRFPAAASERHGRRADDMPPGCECARVLLGKTQPHECRMYGSGCHPRQPIGPCMVSHEGTCHVRWIAGFQKEPEHALPHRLPAKHDVS